MSVQISMTILWNTASPQVFDGCKNCAPQPQYSHCNRIHTLLRSSQFSWNAFLYNSILLRVFYIQRLILLLLILKNVKPLHALVFFLIILADWTSSWGCVCVYSRSLISQNKNSFVSLYWLLSTALKVSVFRSTCNAREERVWSRGSVTNSTASSQSNT